MKKPSTKRLIADKRVQTTPGVDFNVKITIDGSEPPGVPEGLFKNIRRIEFGAFVNTGEIVKVRFLDPHHTRINNLVKNVYFPLSRTKAPLGISVSFNWNDADYTIATQHHAVIDFNTEAVHPSYSHVEFVGLDYPSYWLSGGDAAGAVYEGNVVKAIKEVVSKYGKGIKLDLRGSTKDSIFNKWYQCRLPPKQFIMSLLEYSVKFNSTSTKWLVWPDGNNLIICEQGLAASRHRATYEQRGIGTRQPHSPSDLLGWSLIGNNALQMSSFAITTSGMSSLSGMYLGYTFDPTRQGFTTIADSSIPNKLNPTTDPETAFTKSTSKPMPIGPYGVGWTTVPSLPEQPDIGLRYDEYISSIAANTFLDVYPTLLRCRFRVPGHYIWSGSEGLGADTITVVMMDVNGEKHFLHGDWIVYGFRHIAKIKDWFTDLYCYRLDYDSISRRIPKGA